MTFTVLALGGNIGNVTQTFQWAIDALNQAGMKDIKVSGFRQTAPLDCPPDCADFTNGALCGFWDGSAEELLKLCQQLEIDAGRPANHEKNSPRPLDLDIITFGDMQINLPHLMIPHPETVNRLFVLEPAAEIAPELIVPGTGKSFNALLESIRQINNSA